MQYVGLPEVPSLLYDIYLISIHNSNCTAARGGWRPDVVKTRQAEIDAVEAADEVAIGNAPESSREVGNTTGGYGSTTG